MVHPSGTDSTAIVSLNSGEADPVVRVAGELDHPAARELAVLLDARRSCAEDLIVDMDQVTYCSVAAARVLRETTEGLLQLGITVTVHCHNTTIEQVLDAVGMSVHTPERADVHTTAPPRSPTQTPRRRRAASLERRHERAETMRALERMARLATGELERARLRDQVIADHMNYARHLAHRYTGRRVQMGEDLEQVAYLGLVKAVDNFDPAHSAGFLAYATPMILGEIRRHFRDGTWAVHVPRGMQELTGAMYRAKDELRTELGREATVGELADRLDVEEDVLVAAMDAAGAYRTASLDLPVRNDQDATPLGELIGAEDPGFERAVNHEVLRTLIPELSERDKQILLMRFFRNMTQAEIGEHIGISQMQVSRLINKIIARLRDGFGDLP